MRDGDAVFHNIPAGIQGKRVLCHNAVRAGISLGPGVRIQVSESPADPVPGRQRLVAAEGRYVGNCARIEIAVIAVEFLLQFHFAIDAGRGHADIVFLRACLAKEYLCTVVGVISAADAPAVVGIRNGRNRTAGNRDIAAVRVVAAADRRGLPSGGGCNRTAVDGDRTIAVLAAADARAVVAAGRGYGAAVDRDAAARSGGLSLSAADARAVVAARGGDRTAVDDDGTGIAAFTAADAGSVVAALRGHNAAVNGDLAGVGAP